MKALSYSQFIDVVDRLNSFFTPESWRIGNYGGLPLATVVGGISGDVVIPDCQSVLCVWYDDANDVASFPDPWFDNGEMRLYLL